MYNIHDVNLKTHNTAKYLGITFDCHLNWNAHIDNIYKKASFMLSFLERNLQKCPPHVKERCFNALALSDLFWNMVAALGILANKLKLTN